MLYFKLLREKAGFLKKFQVLSRRNITTEQNVSSVVTKLTKECRQHFPPQVLSALEKRDKEEREALEKYLHSADDESISLPGRRSGNKEWRMSRSELGSDENCSLNSSACRVRNCIDEHVTKIYNAFSPLFDQFVDHAVSKTRAMEVLQVMRKILLDLRKLPFKSRRIALKSIIKDEENNFYKMVPFFEQLLYALSLKIEFDNDRAAAICLADDPVRTSLSLPVVLDALDDTIRHLNDCKNFDRDSLSLPLLKLNRICSGSVLASGEELPIGIVSQIYFKSVFIVYFSCHTILF